MDSLVVKDFSLERTLECGQYFRYRQADGFFLVGYRDRLFKIRQEHDRLLFDNADKKFIVNFFRLDQDYRSVIKSISRDDFIRKAIKANYGLRIMRQDPWECLISYICSANNNIPRIKSNIQMISERFGKPLLFEGNMEYSFPEPGRIDNQELIKSCRVGFRARFIHQANLDINEKTLTELKRKDYAIAREELMGLKGVGEKIADCVCLFALEKLEAFPVDVWIRRVMTENYFNGKEVSNKKIRDFALDYFGEYAGYANQFLFYYRRLLK